MKNAISKEQCSELYKDFGKANKKLSIYFLAMVFFMITDEDTKSGWLFSTVKKIYKLAIKHNMPNEHVEAIYRCLALKATELDELLYALSEFHGPNVLIRPNLQERIKKTCGDPYVFADCARKYLLEARDGYIEFVRSHAVELSKAKSLKKE